MKFFIIYQGFFPSSKAASIFTVESAKALLENGHKVEIIVPKRIGAKKGNIKYKSAEGITVRYLPTIDLYFIPFIEKIAFYLSHLSFCFFLYFHLKKHVKRGDVVQATDPLPLVVANKAGLRTFYEIHDFPSSRKAHIRNIYTKAIQGASWILATNKWKKDKLIEEFKLTEKKILVSPNGVDLEFFKASLSRETARARLKVKKEGSIALYTGHLYDWKGADVFASAAKYIPEVQCYFVGGTKNLIEKFKKQYPEKNIHFLGFQEHFKIPIWQQAADCLILPNTAKLKISRYYTSPMKLFEYMASNKPIVASGISSIQQIINQEQAFFFKADDAKDLARQIRFVLDSPKLAKQKALAALELASQYSWKKRAKKILSFISSQG